VEVVEEWEGPLIGGGAFRMGQEIAGIKMGGRSYCCGLIARDFRLGKMTMTWPAGGPHLSSRRRRGKGYRFGRDLGWAFGRFPARAERLPPGLFLFFLFFSLFHFYFSFVSFAKSSKWIQTNFELCKINFPLLFETYREGF
jgi:hypothetical protein